MFKKKTVFNSLVSTLFYLIATIKKLVLCFFSLILQVKNICFYSFYCGSYGFVQLKILDNTGGFRYPASTSMDAILDFHNDVFFFLIIIATLVGWLLVRICYKYYYTNFQDMRKEFSFPTDFSEKGICEDLLYHARTYIAHDLRIRNIWNFNFSLFVRRFKPIKNRILRRRLNVHKNLEIIWTLIPTFILVIIVIPSLALLYALNEIFLPQLTFKVTGNQWYWTYEFIGNYLVSFIDYTLCDQIAEEIRFADLVKELEAQNAANAAKSKPKDNNISEYQKFLNQIEEEFFKNRKKKSSCKDDEFMKHFKEFINSNKSFK
jgi:heme/copper-type cytochrome/quinol oxidase subunit 2